MIIEAASFDKYGLIRPRHTAGMNGMPSGLTFALDAQSGRVIVAKVRSTKLMVIVAMVTAHANVLLCGSPLRISPITGQVNQATYHAAIRATRVCNQARIGIAIAKCVFNKTIIHVAVLVAIPLQAIKGGHGGTRRRVESTCRSRSCIRGRAPGCSTPWARPA